MACGMTWQTFAETVFPPLLVVAVIWFAWATTKRGKRGESDDE